MSSRLKKLLSLVLVFVLVFQMMPASAFADGLRAEGSAPTLTLPWQNVQAPWTAFITRACRKNIQPMMFYGK